MGLLFLDGFDHYSTTELTTWWTQIYTQPAVAPVIGSTGRRSSQGCRWSFTNQACQAIGITLNPGDATCVVGMAFTMTGPFGELRTGGSPLDPASNASPCNALIHLRQGGTDQLAVQINTNGTLAVYRGSTLLGNTTVALSAGVTSYIEFKTLIHPSTGTVEIKIDGVASGLALTGQNTRNTSSSTWDEVVVGNGTSGSGSTKTWTIDDLYIVDGTGSVWNTFKGDTYVSILTPTSNGNSRDFTRSTGADDYALVDETLVNGDTDYLESATATNKVSMGYSNCPVAGADIYGLVVAAYGRKTDAGAAGHKALVRISGTDYVGTEVGLTSSYSFKKQAWDTSPASGVAWTESEVNAAEFGAQKSA